MKDLYDRNVGVVGTGEPTSSLEDIATAAKEFQRALNAAPHLVHVEMDVHLQRTCGLPDRNYYSFRITTVESVYP